MSFPMPPRGGTLAVPPHAPRPTPIKRAASPMIAGLGAAPDEDQLDRFWSDVKRQGTPVIEADRDNACTYTFVYRGAAATERVAFLGNKIADPLAVEDTLFERLEGTEVWWFSIRLGASWRGSYGIAAQEGERPAIAPERAQLIERRRARSLAATDAEHHHRIEDWYDLQYYVAADRFARENGRPGSSLPSVASGPAAPSPHVALPSGDVANTAPHIGRVVPVRDAPRTGLWWHVPSGPRPAEWDVLVLLDGERWLDAGAELDAWQASGALPPTVALLVGAGELDQRVRDLTCSPDFVDDLVRVIDRAADDFPELGAPLTRDPQRTRIAGQSLGGLTALYAQCARPERFGVSVSQSGSFWWPNARAVPDADADAEAAPTTAEWLTNAIRTAAPRLGTVAIEVGTQEWALLEPTRRLRAALDGACVNLLYQEFEGGHDEACWFATLPRLLRDTVR